VPQTPHPRTTRRFAALVALFGWAATWSTAHAGESVEKSGDVLRLAIPAAAWTMTFRRDDNAGRRAFYKSFAANVLGTHVLKEIVDKERPDGTDDRAFPSGHASMAFQGAAFLHRRYGLRRAWWAYALSTYVGWTRVDADEHEAVDVAAGAAVGIASAFLLTQPNERGIALVPEIGGGYVGLRVSGTLWPGRDDVCFCSSRGR
jgi:membrane-associated phospholipid phosphatase